MVHLKYDGFIQQTYTIYLNILRSVLIAILNQKASQSNLSHKLNYLKIDWNYLKFQFTPRPSTKSCAKLFGNEWHVNFTGFNVKSETANLLRHARLLVMPRPQLVWNSRRLGYFDKEIIYANFVDSFSEKINQSQSVFQSIPVCQF